MFKNMYQDCQNSVRCSSAHDQANSKVKIQLSLLPHAHRHLELNVFLYCSAPAVRGSH